MHVAQGVLGIAAILGFAWMVSEDRRAFPWRTVIAGMLLQLLIAAVLLKVPQFKGVFLALNEALMSLEQATAVCEAVVTRTKKEGRRARAYISTIAACPYEGVVPPERVFAPEAA